MKTHKKILIILLFILFNIVFSKNVLADNENITYKAEYASSVSYKLTINGLEKDDEKYDMYSAMICQETDVTGEDFYSVFGKDFPISYNEQTGSWEGISLTSTSSGQVYSGFDKKGQYYVYVAAKKVGDYTSTGWEILDGPTAIETPDLPPVGERINITIFENSTGCNIRVNAIDTMSHNGIQRTIQFYVGEVTDTELLRNLSDSKNGAYDELLQYAKKQVPTLRQDSFKDTKTGYLDYNIVADYPIENGKYYFIYSILDNENDTYIDVEDVGIYNGVSSEGVSRLDNFEYTGIVEGGEEEEIDTNKSDNVPDRNNDETTANRILPKAGKTSILIVFLCVTIIITVILYMKNRKYKDIK